MKQFPLLFPLLVVLVAMGCKREADVPPPARPEASAASTPAAPTPPPAPAVAGTDAVAVIQHSSPASDSAAFDSKAFAGRFVRANASLAITTDGRFVLVGANGTPLRGTWTLQPDGKSILLDPDSKSDPDQLFDIVSNDAVQPNGMADAVMRREGTGH